MFTRHQLYQLYEEGCEPTVRLIESLLDYIEELKHDPHNRQQRQIANLAGRIAKLQARLRRVGEELARQQCLNYELKRRIAELEGGLRRQRLSQLGVAAGARSARSQGGQRHPAHEEPAPTFGQASGRSARASGSHPRASRAAGSGDDARPERVPRLRSLALVKLHRQV